MEQPTQVTLLQTEKDLFSKISDPVYKSLIKTKELAKTTNTPVGSKMRQGIRAMLLEELANENLVDRVMKSDEYGKILMALNSLLLAEIKKPNDEKYIVRPGVPKSAEPATASKATAVRPSSAPAVPKADLQQAAMARHEPDQLVFKDGVWIKESEI